MTITRELIGLVDKTIATYAYHGTSDYMVVDDGKARQTLLDRIESLSAEVERLKKPKEKIAPVQGWPQGIPWSLHLEAYAAYSKKWAPQPALVDLEGRNCRGGFSVGELDEFIPGWRERASELAAVKAEVERLKTNAAAAVNEYAQLEAERDQLRSQLEAQGEAVAFVKFKDGEVNYCTDDNIVISNTPGDCMDESIEWLPVFTHPAPAAHAWGGDPSTQDYASTQPAPAAPVVEHALTWQQAESICNLQQVEEAIRNLLNDQTGDNATALIQVIYEAALHPTQPKGEKA